mmetsp:Transcript_38258/g.151404  ORF Transcript_38258/g.151404 Transcript_38258/m.151404 type:complete len:95 (-) Transcript_38258:1341-1625(-)
MAQAVDEWEKENYVQLREGAGASKKLLAIRRPSGKLSCETSRTPLADVTTIYVTGAVDPQESSSSRRRYTGRREWNTASADTRSMGSGSIRSIR